jgi:hypothetical protein
MSPLVIIAKADKPLDDSSVWAVWQGASGPETEGGPHSLILLGAYGNRLAVLDINDQISLYNALAPRLAKLAEEGLLEATDD